MWDVWIVLIQLIKCKCLTLTWKKMNTNIHDYYYYCITISPANTCKGGPLYYLMYKAVPTWKSAVVRMCRPSGAHRTAHRPADPSSTLQYQSGFSMDHSWKYRTLVNVTFSKRPCHGYRMWASSVNNLATATECGPVQWTTLLWLQNVSQSGPAVRC